MVKVELVDFQGMRPSEKISFAGRSCYEGAKPKVGHLLDVKEKLFDTGHHTTLQHNYYTFFIEGIAVSDVTFGLHLASPFYNSSQRSGRYCADMFAKPDLSNISGYIRSYWPTVGDGDIKEIMDFIDYGISIYNDNMEDATIFAERLIAEERPFASKFIKCNAVKYAQEQMRVFVPTIFPTALTFTIDLSSLVALYYSAWSPALVDVTDKMKNAVLEKDNSIAYMFADRKNDDNFDVVFLPGYKYGTLGGRIITEQKMRLVSIGDPEMFIYPDPKDLHPIDLLHFRPRYMDNNTEEIKTDIEISVAAMGQDQRHRTVKHGQIFFTGNFYLPPIPAKIVFNSEAKAVLDGWLNICGTPNIPTSLCVALAPYGAMVAYRKSASYNAIIHESLKRLCYRSQEEIYNLHLSLREEVVKTIGLESPLTDIFSPTCVRTGKCGEGKGYCGRDRKKDSFVKRMI